ncbi:uncharacterized protein [Misgurnus anguillicaudatus]|uniref:uncharacterized protein isoform X2 n=1 Tax=Misgurnus anguillicaudatus TaxID=75329 RepID=UPI003CCFBF11
MRLAETVYNKRSTPNEKPRQLVNPDQSKEEGQQTPVTHGKKHKPMYSGGLRVFSILTGKTNNSHKKFTDTLINQIQDIREVPTMDQSNIVLVFCPIVSQAGANIEAALKTFTDSTASKLNVIVVLHHTFDPEKTVPDSSRCVNRTDILTVDCLFYEDTGLLECQKNQDAMDKVVNWLKEEVEKRGLNVSQRQIEEASKSDASNQLNLVPNTTSAVEEASKSDASNQLNLVPNTTSAVEEASKSDGSKQRNLDPNATSTGV